MTNMKAAFERAGFRGSTEHWPSDALLQVGINAMIRHADNAERCQHAIFRACYNDAALLRQLILPWWRQAASSLIGEARRELQRRAQTGEASVKEKQAATVIDRQDQRERQRQQKERERDLAEQAQRDREYQVYLQQWQETKARDFTIEDRPFWQVSTRAARVWQRRQGHRVRFVELLLSGVPEDDRPISHYRRPDEVDALWDQAFRG